MNKVCLYIIVSAILFGVVGCETVWDSLLLKEGNGSSTAEEITRVTQPIIPIPWDGIVGAIVGGISVWYTNKWRSAKAAGK